jgi:hypothetical protein
VLKTIATLLCCFSLAAQTPQVPAPDRTVKGTTVTSTHDPAVRIQFPPTAQYVGAARWPLYDLADCELHVFVDADPQRNVTHLYWVQFEGYLPTKPDMHHTYDSPRHLQLGGLDFYVDTWVRASTASTRSGSDREHVTKLLEAHGYKMPANTMDVRLVHLLDAEKRKELMIIYSEDLASSGFTADDLKEGGKAHDKWPSLEAGLIERAKEKIEIHPG